MWNGPRGKSIFTRFRCLDFASDQPRLIVMEMTIELAGRSGITKQSKQLAPTRDRQIRRISIKSILVFPSEELQTSSGVRTAGSIVRL